MKHLGTQPIETDRLILRQFTLDDAQSMYTNWASDPAVTKFLMWPTHTSVDVSKAVLESWLPNYEKTDYYVWAIVPKEFGEPIGSIAAVKNNDQIQMVHIGYCIGKKFWHKGIISEALAALLEFFIVQVGVNRVESRHDPNNPYSGNVMKKCGMQYEGRIRQGDWNNEGIVDAALYAILREDYLR